VSFYIGARACQSLITDYCGVAFKKWADNHQQTRHEVLLSMWNPMCLWSYVVQKTYL